MSIKRALRAVLFMVLAVGLIGCDAGVEPQSSASPETAFQDESSYRAFLGKLYGGLVLTGQDGPAGNPDLELIDEGFSQYVRAYWQLQELPTDEAVLAWGDEGIQPLNEQQWTPDNPFVEAMYNRIFFQASMVNEFLRQTTEAKLNERGVAEDMRQRIQQFRAEARFLRALSYWHGVDLFGGMPIVTEEDEIGLQSPTSNTREEVFNFVEQELLDIEARLPAPGSAEYGRADQAAVWMVLSKLYLNAEVYVGEARYEDVVTYTDKIIGSGYELADEYMHNFKADNHTSPEIIFAVPQDGEQTRTFGGTTFLGHAAIGGGTMSAGTYGFGGGWWGLRTTSNVVGRYPTDSTDVDARAIFFTQGQSKEIGSLTEFTDGYALPKYQNITTEGETGANSTFPDTDYPMFRLADAYLMYAEAVARGAGNGSMSKAVGLVNDLRERAYGDQSGTITSGELTPEFVLDERSRELIWEGHRRSDLIRSNQFTENGTWAGKGGDIDGTTTPGFRDLYPIPESQLQVNDNLEQNPGYDGS
ncbi:RagB/SusD family nutrient uptake outer membrane protein [Salinibacter altiplanensis]|uniref:RagB/SusD family nutrient uptake outer membrane protein n=1 Tax=Salinibacter altiplanensis TaxID=1803181 RepID=UPI001E2F205B|nr:RagB/SusD family nutrient uptake outer membrane protein [Salinibacter altiplanensis]